MSRLVVAIALLGAISFSVPAFAAQDCLAYCQERCGSKGIIARSNVTKNANNETVPRSVHLPAPFDYGSISGM